MYEVVIERDLDLKVIYSQEVKLIQKLTLDADFLGFLVKVLANLGGLLVFFYLIFYLLTACLTAGKLEDYLVSELFLEPAKDDPDFKDSIKPSAIRQQAQDKSAKGNLANQDSLNDTSQKPIIAANAAVEHQEKKQNE